MPSFLPSIESPSHLVFGATLVLLIAFSSKVPFFYRNFVDSLLGRVLGIAVIYGVIKTMGWIYGILTAMVFLLMLHHSPRRMMEGFTEKRTVGSRWYVEQVLGETPEKIVVDRSNTTVNVA